MKNSKRLLTCTLGLMLSVGMLVGCGGKKTHTVTFYAGNEELKVEKVKDGELCPNYTPQEKEGYHFVGWFDNRQHEGDPFELDKTPITEDIDLFAWYKENFKQSTDTYYLVGSFVGGAWDGDNASPVPADRKMTLNTDKLAEEHNVFEFTIDRIDFGNKFRIIKSTDGVMSDGWTDDFGFDLVSKVLDTDGTEMNKADAIKEEDSKNIGVLFSGKLKVSLDLNSDYTPKGEIVLSLLERIEVQKPTSISLIGSASGWTDYYDLTTSDEGDHWTGTYTFNANDVFKLRANHAWDASWGYANLTEQDPADAFAEETSVDADTGEEKGTGNILVKQAGTYDITFEFLTGNVTLKKSATQEKPLSEKTIAALYDLKKGATVEFDAIFMANYSNYNKAGTKETKCIYVAHGDTFMMIYGVSAFDDSYVAGETILRINGTLDVFNGLIQVKNATMTVVDDVRVPAPTDFAITENTTLGKMDVSRLATLKGTVKSIPANLDNLDSFTESNLVITIGEKDFNIFVKKSNTIDFAKLAEKAVVGQEITLKAFVSIYDKNVTDTDGDFASSTGWQFVAPMVVA